MSADILIVDDSLTVRMDLKETFESAGFQTALCATLEEARTALARDSFALVVLDVQLPDGDGVQFLEEIRAMQSADGTSVILLSSEAEIRDRIRGLKKGADEYLGKPYDPGYVAARAIELVRHNRLAAAFTAETVLVIDDSPTFRAELRDALIREGFNVIAAVTGEEGLQAATDLRPNAVVVDNILSGIDGLTVVRRIRFDAALRRLPCLLLTASDDGNAEIRALDAGADAFVRKDEDMGVILARLRAIMRGSRVTSADRDMASLLGPKKVLVVDDSETYLQELACVLRAEGYEVVLARSGEEAVELLSVAPVDCVLLDLLMPGMDGRETCRRVKAVPIARDIPIVILTAFGDPSAMIGSLAAGADDFISKSSSFEVLRARVRAQLRRKNFEDENRRIREQLLRKELEASEARAAQQLAEARAALAEELDSKNHELEAANRQLFTEIDERRRVEREILRLNVILDERVRFRTALLQSILDTIPDGVVVIEASGTIKSFSLAAARMFGYRSDEVSGLNVCRLFALPNGEDCDLFLARYLTTVGIGRVVTGLSSDGRTFPIELSVGEVVQGDGRLFNCLVHDLTTRQLAERREQELQAKVIHTSRLTEMGQMAAGLAHELNQPLTAAGNYLATLRRILSRAEDTTALDAAVSATEKVAAQLQRATEIMRRQREFAKKSSPERRSENILNLLEEASALALVGAKERGIQVSYRADFELPSVLVDKVQIQQVVVNLLRNAVEAMETTSRRDILIEIAPVSNGFVPIAVVDTGPGIAQLVVDRLFQPFISTKAQGMGVGLWLCLTIIQAHGGRLWAEPNPEGGTIFRFTVPVAMQDVNTITQ